MKLAIATLAGLATLGACTTMGDIMEPELPVWEPSVAYNEEAVAWFNKDGDNKLTGSAFIKQAGGGVVTCAGTEVLLKPINAYTKEATEHFYGDVNGGFFDPYYDRKDTLKTNEKNNRTYRLTKCDAAGEFEFENLPDGDYYITSSIIWSAGGLTQGGAISDRFQLEGGETKEIILTP